MIRIEALRYRYPGQREIAFADFSLSEGEPWLLLGQSGSGKTTLLHLIGGLLRSQQGQIIIKDTNISGLSEAALDRFRGQHIGFVFQRNHLISALSVRQNLLLAPYLAGVRQDAGRVEAVLEQLGISDKADVNVRELSYGQAQRVAIARALLNRPTVILADEPTSALDDNNCDKVIDLLLDASRLNNTTLVVATHDHRLKHKIPHQINLAQA
ncbi:MAG: ABC transporter ATP-binding protein [Bacteroidetes bacterium]|nr:ABC transporter ATP-binding protein [Bacteroidota bacterium]